MKKILSLLMLFGLLTALAQCGMNRPLILNNQSLAVVQPTVNINTTIRDNSNQTNSVIINEKNLKESDEITNCSPQKIYKDETLIISLKKLHGLEFAIYNEKTKDFYFLTANGQWYFPYISPDEFKNYLTLKLNTSEVRNRTDEEVESVGGYKTKPFFSKTGWYQVIIGHHALDVDFIDMPVTGSCRVYYVNKKRPKKE